MYDTMSGALLFLLSSSSCFFCLRASFGFSFYSSHTAWLFSLLLVHIFIAIFGVLHPALLHFLDHREHSRGRHCIHLGESIFGMKEKEEKLSKVITHWFLCGLLLLLLHKYQHEIGKCARLQRSCSALLKRPRPLMNTRMPE